MLQKYLQSKDRPKEELLHDMFLLNKDITLEYMVILKSIKIGNQQQLRKMVFKLRSEKFLEIQTVQNRGYIYKGIQLARGV